MDDSTICPSRPHGDPLRVGATMPGHGVARRSGNEFSATIQHIPSPSFLDELVRERWEVRTGKGCRRPSQLGLPQRSMARPLPSKTPAGVPSCGLQTTSIFLALRSGCWTSFHTFPWQSRKAPGVWWQTKSISAGLVPCSPSPTSASSSLSSRFTSSPVLPGKACVVLNLQLLYSIK